MQKIIKVLIVIIALAVASVILSLTTSLSLLQSARIIFGSVYVLFIPGFVISYIFFPETKPFEESKKEGKEESEGNKENKKSIDWIERIALSFALSIAIVPLVVFYLNLLGIKINLINSFLTILGIIAVSLVVLVYKKHKTK